MALLIDSWFLSLLFLPVPHVQVAFEFLKDMNLSTKTKFKGWPWQTWQAFLNTNARLPPCRVFCKVGAMLPWISWESMWMALKWMCLDHLRRAGRKSKAYLWLCGHPDTFQEIMILQLSVNSWEDFGCDIELHFMVSPLDGRAYSLEALRNEAVIHALQRSEIRTPQTMTLLASCGNKRCGRFCEFLFDIFG